MKSCHYCGANSDNGTYICPECRSVLEKSAITNSPSSADAKSDNKKDFSGKIEVVITDTYEDEANDVANVLALLLPAVGAWMFLAMYTRTPRKATVVGKFALLGMVLWVVIYLVFSQIIAKI